MAARAVPGAVPGGALVFAPRSAWQRAFHLLTANAVFALAFTLFVGTVAALQAGIFALIYWRRYKAGRQPRAYHTGASSCVPAPRRGALPRRTGC